MEALDLGARQRTRPDGHPRAPLELAATRDHSLGDAAEQVPGRELLAYGLGGRRGLLQVRRRQEDEGEVDLGGAEPSTAGLAGRLRRGVPGRLRGRQTGPDPAGERLRLHRQPQSMSANPPAARITPNSFTCSRKNEAAVTTRDRSASLSEPRLLEVRLPGDPARASKEMGKEIALDVDSAGCRR